MAQRILPSLHDTDKPLIIASVAPTAFYPHTAFAAHPDLASGLLNDALGNGRDWMGAERAGHQDT